MKGADVLEDVIGFIIFVIIFSSIIAGITSLFILAGEGEKETEENNDKIV